MGGPTLRRADPHSTRILAFQPECNPPAHTTAASRIPATANTSPRALERGQLDNTVGTAGGHDGADPAELGAHSEHFSPPPLYKTGDGLTTLKAPPPAK
jgi:hypothetical protein